MNSKKIEILAPAGSMDALRAALRTGADAVYIGGKKFSARNNALNFNDDEIKTAADLCHLYGAKLYLAVNTIAADNELVQFCCFIKNAAESGIDAFIVQDWGCAELIRGCIPDAVLHASTQMSVHTAAGAELLKELGFARVVPARELTADSIRKISGTGIETEVFVHGALCMSVSGQCYLSAVMGTRSANRGCCGQACRLPFSAAGNKNASALSLKDLSLIPKITELSETNPDSLKIEGRMKRPEYTAVCVHELHAALNGGTPDMDRLGKVFSRSGFTDGYFTGRRTNMFGIRQKSDVVSAQSVFPEIHELYRNEKGVHTMDIHAEIKNSMPVKITAHCGNFTAEVFSEPPETARSRPIDLDMLSRQLSRLGGTVYTAGNITAEIDDGLTVTAGNLNKLRRSLTEKMNDILITQNRPAYHITDYSPAFKKSAALPVRKKIEIRAFCRTAQQLEAALESAAYVIAPAELLIKLSDNILDKNRIIISPPRFISNEEKTLSQLTRLRKNGFSRMLCHTPDSIALGKKAGLVLHGGFGLNIFNSYSAEAMKRLGLEDVTFSFEAKLSQINNVSADIPVGAVIGGRLPVMLTRNCPIKNEVGCGRCTKALTDRTGRIFPVCCCEDYTEILNSSILYMPEITAQPGALSFGIIMLYDENANQTRALLNWEKPDGNLTHGLYYRGIE